MSRMKINACWRTKHQPGWTQIALAVATMGVPGGMAMAAEEDGSVMLRSVITTATRTETVLDAAPGNASLIDRAEIERTPRASIKELVRGQEGVITGQLRGQSDLSPEITLRGIPNQARTMLLIDGVPVQTSYSGQAQAIGGLNVEEIQQVEIVRGPYSSLYGSSAMGGVVNLGYDRDEGKICTHPS